MVHFELPDARQRRLVYYLAMEEYIAANIRTLIPADAKGRRDAFFIWQVPPTVIFGRNQVFEAEVNVPYCQEHGVQLYRRKSGGGCVYADMGNIMVSYVSDSSDVSSTFDAYLEKLAACLSSLGPDARRTGRNDVLIDGRKVSGNAFFRLPSSSIVHGTLLYDSDFEELVKTITPSQAKIESKGVSSVRQHVINFREALATSGNDIARNLNDISAFKRYLIEWFNAGDATITLNEEQMLAIEEIEKSYLDPDFLSGRKHSWSVLHEGRIAGIGEIRMELKMDGDLIEECHLGGDFFPLKDGLDAYLSQVLKGCRNNDAEAGTALQGAIELPEFVLGLDGSELRSLLFGKCKNNG